MDLKIILLIIIFFSNFISSFALLSDGSLFKNNFGKDTTLTTFLNFIHYIILIAITIIAIKHWGFIYLIITPLISLFIAQTLSYIFIKTIFKNNYKYQKYNK